MKLLSRAHDFSFLTSEINGVRFELFASSQSFLTCIVCWFESSTAVMMNWQAIQSIVSVRFKPEGGHSKWNVYLVLMCPDSLKLRDKYVIQNDRYAARKIILDGLGELPDSPAVEKLVNVELLGADLELAPVSDNSEDDVDTPIAAIVKGVPSGASAEAKEARGAMINKLIEFLSENENQKG
ncbi:ABC-three component system middle component 1 [Pseudomonas simiae]|uniref:ABC-three component system middle component 1 n=1 Tax=Pseudomonas simiae TaxID=321846 RepID=UPI0011B29DEC|nr:ABC-three component system middle component 1 [Pseudomonas simiae]